MKGPSVEIEYPRGLAFTPALRARLVAPMPGHVQRALNIYRFTVDRDGKMVQCGYEEQRGSGQWAESFCGEARNERYDPPFSAFDKDGVAQGWYIMRIVTKTGG